MSELTWIGVVLASLLLVAGLVRQLVPGEMPRSTRITVDLVVAGLVVGVVFVVAQLTGLV